MPRSLIVQPVYIAYLNRLDIEALAMTDDEILARDRDRPRRPRPRRDRDRAARASRARRVATAISTCCAAPSARRSTSPASRWSATSSTTTSSACRRSSALLLFDPRTGVPKAILDASRHHRHAHRRDHRDRRQVPGAQGLEGARPYRRARHRLLERAPARPSCSTSTRSASIRAGRKAATPSPSG